MIMAASNQQQEINISNNQRLFHVISDRGLPENEIFQIIIDTGNIFKQLEISENFSNDQTPDNEHGLKAKIVEMHK